MRNLFARALVSLVVPPLCVACREPELSGRSVCPACEALLIPLPDRRCGRCGAPSGQDCPSCSECRGRRLGFDRAWSPFAYEGVARGLVAGLKSRGELSVAQLMGAALAGRTPEDILRGTLVPVPAHPSRRRRHGFNHALELGRALARASGPRLCDVLRRESAARPQVGLERRARLANAERSVGIRGGDGRPLPEGPFLLVDDVYTTGATLDACARALRRAGAREVAALTFARAVRGATAPAVGKRASGA
jgi:ComF family protein